MVAYGEKILTYTKALTYTKDFVNLLSIFYLEAAIDICCTKRGFL